MSTNKKPVGAFIREIRKQKGIPLRKLASAIDIDQSTLAKMEKGQRPFSLDMAPGLAKALEIDFKELQILLLASLVIYEHGDEEYFEEGLKMILNHITEDKLQSV